MRSTSSNSLPGRPWTPPEDVFGETHAPDFTPPLNQHGGSLQSSPLQQDVAEAKRPRKLEIRATGLKHTESTLEASPELSAPEDLSRAGAQTPSHGSYVKTMPAHNTHPFIADPITPIKTPWSSGLLPNNDIPQYPYTPESIRTTKSYGVRPLSPLPSMPWDTKDSCSSPMQEALLSCASNLESLILSREPTDEQMEYLVTKFEEMAGFLSAPDSQSKQTDDHLFSELDGTPDATGLGIVTEEATKDHVDAHDLALSQGYILEVGKYIESVKGYVNDLTMRMEEVKQLNSIQLDVIGELRRDLRKRIPQPKKGKVEPAENPDLGKNILPRRNGFWSSISEALDSVSEMLHEW
ncbi:uncharacterized protein N0V89_003924 [Didymosphaeria variabile]|uniref:Uncharacterized protein n=1 Tax=Didymosphaeria variabile TaxID=1932322 RepID=A0A9W9CBZ1_9PLEO|nr:uncharacterized protein N0V89_003924 [Didymosphaeria variabile]KAJ4355899.1 hypothetical protein N0V89_003924 [Didymosphaeria variabile]